MRPRRLDIEGFGTFRDPTTLDFTDADYFALVGPTGSGKTTVIDAICFALYGSAARWPRRNQVSLALAPSTTSARVALVFEVAGTAYAALRVLTRAASGTVSTKQSRLISLPPDPPLDGDLADLLELEVAALADSPATMDQAIIRLLGLTFDQFTQSVVLPQGGFAKFLHAEKRERQDLLVSLLGLSMYERVAKQANQLAGQARVRLDTLTGELGQYADATEQAEAEANVRCAELTTLEAGLDALLAPWRAASAARAEVEREAAASVTHLSALEAVTAPGALEDLAGRRARATEAAEAAEHRESKAAEALAVAESAAADAGEATGWQRLVDDHRRLAELAVAVVNANGAVDATAAEAAAARHLNDETAAAAEAAQAVREALRIAHQADHVASALVAGAACPVCLQPVTVVPERPPHEALTAADTRVAAAEAARKAAAEALGKADLAHLRALDGRQRLRDEHTGVAERLTGQPDGIAAQAGLVSAQLAAAALAMMRREEREATEAARRARSAARSVQDEWNEIGRRLSQAREPVAHLGPPATTGDHVADWAGLTAWARSEAAGLRGHTEGLEFRRAEAEGAEQQQRAAVVELLRTSGVATPARFTEVSVTAAVTRAVAEAEATRKTIADRRATASRLTRQIAGEQQQERLHRDLGLLLGARHFERWLVEEALQAMMVDASATLSDLTNGQFELEIDARQDILVVDHNDAGTKRPVQTLSGGETFQASLALALALSSQIAALSPQSGQLDTILLDEGFGTLDPSTLDVVAGTLEQLAGGGERTVGIVTHVAALAERVPVQFRANRVGSRSTIEKVWT